MTWTHIALTVAAGICVLSWSAFAFFQYLLGADEAQRHALNDGYCEVMEFRS